MTPILSADLLHYYRTLSRQTLTVVDVETTGRYPDHNRVIEIAVIQGMIDGGISVTQSHLINSGTSIPSKICQLTGISQSMVDGAASNHEVWPLYEDMLRQGILTGHNIAFDYSFLQAEYQRLGIAYNRPLAEQFCTVRLARLMLADLPSRSLPQLVQHFQFDIGRSHRAEADARACWMLAQQLLTEIGNEPDEVILAKFKQEWIPLNMAARILKCSHSVARSRLKEAQVSHRLSQRNRGQVLMYRRGDVECVANSSEGRQLSLL